MLTCTGYAAESARAPLRRIQFERTGPGPSEVLIDVMFCGVCHSDIHQVRDEWHNTVYPCLPGHEIVGKVYEIGEAVTLHKVGDIVGVGCMIDSCRKCPSCTEGSENYCEGPNSWLATYNGPMVPGAKAPTRENSYGRDNTYGGYSNQIVVPEDFVLKIPASLKPEAAAPLLCAGVTTFSPMRHFGVKAGDKVGILGLGGLGHIAVKLAKALGCEVTVFTTHAQKRDAAEALGAHHVVLENDEDAMRNLTASFDFILSTIPQKHDVNPYFPLLKRDKTLVAVGALEPMAPLNNMLTAFHRQSFSGSLIGSIKETQEVLDFCAANDITADIELITIDQINDAFEKVINGDVRFRYVIDLASLKT